MDNSRKPLAEREAGVATKAFRHRQERSAFTRPQTNKNAYLFTSDATSL
jgi:hypothetical protein